MDTLRPPKAFTHGVASGHRPQLRGSFGHKLLATIVTGHNAAYPTLNATKLIIAKDNANPVRNMIY
ncbi:MAG: hypothetical protein QNI89_01555 [Desulfobacterales bacterium]|nr:hypothetical protein [Desulfobacterales bacterium]